MQRRNLYFNMLSYIAHAVDTLLTVNEQTGFDQGEMALDFDACFDQLDKHSAQWPEKYSSLIEGVRHFKDLSSLGEDILPEPNIVIGSISDDVRRLHLKPLVLNSLSDHLFVMSSCSFVTEDGTRLADFTSNDARWMGIEYIWAAVTGDAVKTARFFQLLEQRDNLSVVIISMLAIPQGNEQDVFNVYSYAYMLHVNSGMFPIPSALRCSQNISFVAQPPAMIQGMYDQYYDVYNALNDAKHATDLLSRFLKIFQAIELLSYRLKMTKLVNSSSGMRQSAVMQLMANAKAFQEGEEASIKDFFAVVLPNIQGQINTANLTPNCKKFMDEKYGVSFPHISMTNANVAKLVYKLRNSIVHNKATELHFSLNKAGRVQCNSPRYKKSRGYIAICSDKDD